LNSIDSGHRKSNFETVSKEAAMENTVSLEQAVTALRTQYGREYAAGFEDGKADMAKTLEKDLGVNGAQAKQVIEALVEAHTIRWLSTPDAIPNQQGTMGMVVEEAHWDLGE
jgi:hypothetical protein